MSKTDSQQMQSIEPPQSLIAALRTILRPLVRLLIKQQVHHPYLSNLLKALYIEVADAEFQLDEKRVTLSRLSVMTGIHRREAKRVREQVESRGGPPLAVTLGAQIIQRWIAESPLVDAAGRPRTLPREARAGGAVSFQQLVRSVSVDIHPRSILDEWLRLGVATLDEEDCVQLRTAAVVPAKGYDQKAHYLGRNVRDHMSAAFANLDSDDPPFFERSTFYGSIPKDAVPALNDLAREVGQDALMRVNECALAARQSAAEGGERRRINFGVYFYETEADVADDRGDGGEGDQDD